MGLIEPPELLTRHRLTVDEYYRMAETGVLAPGARVELIRGEIVDMAPIGTRHSGTVKSIGRRLTAAVGTRALLTMQDVVRLGDHSEPEPDLMLLRLSPDDYRSAHPGPADVLLLVEVSDTSVRYDREVKLPLYAEAGVAEVWIVDLDARLLRCHRGPRGGEYSDVRILAHPTTLPVPGFEDTHVELTGLFG